MMMTKRSKIEQEEISLGHGYTLQEDEHGYILTMNHDGGTASIRLEARIIAPLTEALYAADALAMGKNEFESAQGTPERYVAKPSGIAQREIKKFRARFKQESEKRSASNKSQITPPNYDDDFYQAIATMNGDDSEE